mmetsp:Transcript_4123/g.3578  ORF Transcript_4123/g.3578 Transcript_4123/m.3578 type:complete len:96 (+) Transcript_4123:147-434(+)
MLSGELTGSVNDHIDVVLTVNFSTCGMYFITGGRDNKARYYKINTINNTINIKLVSTMIRHTDWIISVSISPDNNWVVTGGKDNKACLFNAVSGN